MSILVGGIGFGWFAVDSVRLWRFRRREVRDHDEWFGMLIGLALSGIGIVGFLMYHFDL